MKIGMLIFAFFAYLSVLAISDNAKADENDDFVKTECLPELNKFSASFFNVNRAYIQPGRQSESPNAREKAIQTALNGKGIYLLSYDPTHRLTFNCTLPSTKSTKQNIELTVFSNSKHKSCNSEIPNIDFQLRLNGKLIAEDTMDRNCAFVAGVENTNIYQLSFISLYPTLELCGFGASDYICKKYTYTNLDEPAGLWRIFSPHLKTGGQ